jgi:CO/xanthine dehydrogenase Mo-binding subunit
LGDANLQSPNLPISQSRTIPFADAVQTLIDEGRSPKLRYEYWAPKTQPLGTGGDMHFAFSYAVHAALVSVDTETGEVAVERVVSAHDVGRAINILSLTGQIEGGVVMGIGNALTEHYIEENGRPWTRHLGQYKMPGIKHMPAMPTSSSRTPTAEGPYGAKGVGEISSIPISPAITIAIYNAVGVRCHGAAGGPGRAAAGDEARRARDSTGAGAIRRPGKTEIAYAVNVQVNVNVPQGYNRR